MNFAYYIFLLLIIFFLYLLILKNMRLSPKKIRLYMTFVSILFILRYIGLFLLSVIKGGTFVHLLKPLLFLNHLAIPLMVLALSYVYLRWDKLNFNFNYIIATILLCFYCIGMIFFKGKIIFNPTYGYIINVNNEAMLYLISLVLVGFLLVFCVYFFDKPNNNRHGMIYLITALTMVIVENILYLGGIRFFPYPIIGDGIFIIIMNLAVNTFKRQSIKAVSSN
ncbi:hypothetical protein NNC19_14365 [Clostridium sp. SHJSY1]|uniref:hypothetical protein n=1 Tax=Clostridium sp. SHJSY1 TaxID=2942483 RepID=UPI0028769819|nr:hypothetical protein [Clostridium sp. SHJSY1]MDS0526872.1 hypothetical protein [Clostridium sp. SHJSY1]